MHIETTFIAEKYRGKGYLYDIFEIILKKTEEIFDVKEHKLIRFSLFNAIYLVKLK